MGNPAQEPWETSQVKMMEALREWATGFAEINLHMSQWMRLPGSDANAVGQIVWAAQSGTPSPLPHSPGVSECPQDQQPFS